MSRVRILSSNTLKIFAAICMFVDHFGLIFYPQVKIFRIIGRFAFPIFAFMISEGARYTKNKLKYFLTIFSLAVVCQTVYYFFDNGNLYMSILITFSLSLAVIFSLKNFKIKLFDNESSLFSKLIALILFLLSLATVFLMNHLFTVDYGVCGCLAPVFASIFDFKGTNAPEGCKKLDTLTVRVIGFSAGILIMVLSAIEKGGFFSTISQYMLLSIPLLLLYSGERGKLKMKYFFYLFYPLHLVILEGIYIIIRYM